MDHVVTILISINCCQLWIVPCNTIQPITYYDFWRHSYVVDMITFSNSVYIYHPPPPPPPPPHPPGKKKKKKFYGIFGVDDCFFILECLKKLQIIFRI